MHSTEEKWWSRWALLHMWLLAVTLRNSSCLRNMAQPFLLFLHFFFSFCSFHQWEWWPSTTISSSRLWWEKCTSRFVLWNIFFPWTGLVNSLGVFFMTDFYFSIYCTRQAYKGWHRKWTKTFPLLPNKNRKEDKLAEQQYNSEWNGVNGIQF